MARSNFREMFSQWLTDRSVVRHHQYPTRRNTLLAIAIVVAAVPIAILLFPIVLIRKLMFGRPSVTTIAVESEFAHYVQFMELLRGGIEIDGKTLSKDLFGDVVFILGPYKHLGFHSMYSSLLESRIYWVSRRSSLLCQALLVQPEFCLRVTRLDKRRFPSGVRRFSESPLAVPARVVEVRQEILKEHGIEKQNYVLLAVFTLAYELERNPHYVQKTRVLESIGSELAHAIDDLRNKGTEVIRVGSLDDGRARIPRDLVRLEDFSRLGDIHEVALASGCNYFWTDGVGAFWLAVPFRKPILFSNQAHVSFKTWQAIPSPHLMVPVRYQSVSGRDVGLREIFQSARMLQKEVARGEMIMIRNSPTEITEAHQELNARLAGNWVDTKEMVSLQARLRSLCEEFDRFPVQVSSSFLSRNSHLLD